MIFFSWKLNEKKLPLCKEDVFSLTIWHNEGEQARASITLKNPFSQEAPLLQTQGILYYEQPNHIRTVLFQGILNSLSFKNEFMCVDLIAKPLDCNEQLKKLEEENLLHPYWDELFKPHDEPEKLKEILKAKPHTLYWDRMTGKVRLSDIFSGENQEDATPFFYYDSLKVEMPTLPLQSVDVTLEAQWIQRIRGHTNISSLIAKAFPEKIIHTLTSSNFEKAWPQNGKILGRSGYWVSVSRLEELDPIKEIGSPNPHSPYYGPFQIHDKSGAFSHELYVKRSYYTGTLILGWEYRQKRIEKIVFTLKHRVHPLFQNGPKENMHVLLENISPPVPIPFWLPNVNYSINNRIQHNEGIYCCQLNHRSGIELEADLPTYWIFEKKIPNALKAPNCSSFFVTERGVKAFEHGLERARTKLAQSARAMHVSFSGPWEPFIHYTLDHSIILCDPRLPGGCVQGKIISLKITADGATGEKLVSVTLGISPGFESLIPKETENYQNDSDPPIQKTTTGLSYISYKDSLAQGEGLGLEKNAKEYIKAKVFVENSGFQQKEFLDQNLSYPCNNKILKNCSTKIFIKMKSLKPKDKLTHTIHVTIPQPWESPQQVRFP